MPKRMVVTIEVPSRSTAAGMFKWLFNLLQPHNMKVVLLQDLESGAILKVEDQKQ